MPLTRFRRHWSSSNEERWYSTSPIHGLVIVWQMLCVNHMCYSQVSENTFSFNWIFFTAQKNDILESSQRETVEQTGSFENKEHGTVQNRQEETVDNGSHEPAQYETIGSEQYETIGERRYETVGDAPDETNAEHTNACANQSRWSSPCNCNIINVTFNLASFVFGVICFVIIRGIYINCFVVILNQIYTYTYMQ